MPFCKRRPISDYEYSTRIPACIPPPPSSIRLSHPTPGLHLSSSSRDGRRRRRRRIKSPNRSAMKSAGRVVQKRPASEALNPDGGLIASAMHDGMHASIGLSVCPLCRTTSKLSNPSREERRADQQKKKTIALRVGLDGLGGACGAWHHHGCRIRDFARGGPIRDPPHHTTTVIFTVRGVRFVGKVQKLWMLYSVDS